MTKVKLQPNKLSSKKNIGVFYKGGCGGHFLYYFLLASGTYNAFYTRPTIRKVDNIEKIKKLNKPVITCCASGMRSASAASILKQHGIEAINGGSWTKVDSLVQTI